MVMSSVYPLVNASITMEHQHFSWVNQLSMAIFNSYFDITRRYRINMTCDGMTQRRHVGLHGRLQRPGVKSDAQPKRGVAC